MAARHRKRRLSGYSIMPLVFEDEGLDPGYTQETDHSLVGNRPVPSDPPSCKGDITEGVSFRKAMAGQGWDK